MGDELDPVAFCREVRDATLALVAGGRTPDHGDHDALVRFNAARLRPHLADPAAGEQLAEAAEALLERLEDMIRRVSFGEMVDVTTVLRRRDLRAALAAYREGR